MSAEIRIKSALISVYNKEGLEPIIRALHDLGITIYSTGGTQSFIESLGVKCTGVEEVTGFPSIFGGRVKTLHPAIFGGILSRRNVPQDSVEMEKHHIPKIDLVVVDLYPFRETLASGASDQEIIEKIDIGGVSLIRAAAKNFSDVLIIPSMGEYNSLLNILSEKKGFCSVEVRRTMAGRAFEVTSGYDSAIHRYYSQQSLDERISELLPDLATANTLRYGENPHQKGIYYGELNELFEQIQGKQLSYNNLLDIDAAISLISDFTENTFAILKHNNACGIASRKNITDAWNAALQADPVSAFGGVLITNTKITEAGAVEINKIFFEVLIAPEYDQEAIKILSQKKNRIILIQKKSISPKYIFRSALNGILQQDKDIHTSSTENIKIATNKSPLESQWNDLLFANKIVKHTKSNAIVLVKNMQLIASGTGQTSRVDALQQAIDKAKKFGFSLNDAVMASDAFFPFPDCVEMAANEGITAVIQPGGSLKDQDSTDTCNRLGIAMGITGHRHFKH